MKTRNLKINKMQFRPIKTPNSLELEYYRQLRFMIEQIHTRFNNIVIKGMEKDKFIKLIVDEDYTLHLQKLLKDFNSKIDNQFGFKRLLEIALKSVNDVYNYNTINWMARLKSFGIDFAKDIFYSELKPFLNMRVNSNVSLIKNLKDDVCADLEKMIYANFEQGKTFKELANTMTERFGIDKRRATLIARNEIKNTNTQLTKKRMQQFNVDYAIWMTSKDERVRSEHLKFDNIIYEVGKGLRNTKTNKFVEPGEEINCRCVAIPLLETKDEILKQYSKEQTQFI
jgi:SPP1 gp7 family putative phage head morphogenesis protein